MHKNNRKNAPKGRRGNKGPKKPPRKTYNINNLKKPNKFGAKRKFPQKDSDYSAKRVKTEPIKEPEEYAALTSEDDEEEVVDEFQQLLGTFGTIQSNVAIESDSDSEEEEEEEVDAEIQEETIEEEDEDSEHSHLSSDEELPEDEVEPIKSDNESLRSNEDSENIVIPTEATDSQEVDASDDPFNKHFLYEINESLLNSVESTPMKVDQSSKTWPVMGKLTIQIPKCEVEVESNQELVTVAEKKQFATPGVVPECISREHGLKTLHLKQQIANNIPDSALNSERNDGFPFTDLQREMLSVIKNYQDLYFPQRTFQNAEEIRFAYCLHAINHVLKTRTKVIHHNARLNKKDDVPEEFRDQGLVRPKVLIILPFRDAAYKVINNLIELIIKQNKGNVMNKNRFEDEFTGSEITMPKKNPMPEDYEQLFTGNSSDDFKIGITVTKKSVKLYADFYSADIIIASPLGLRPVIGAQGEPERDYDFLASIEVLIFDQMDIFLMQNWDHVLHILKHMHLQPKESHGTDFSRVRTWSLNGWAKYYRQTLLFSSVQMPELSHVFNRHCFNYAGKVRAESVVELPSVRLAYVPIAHIYHKIEANSNMEMIEARFQYFVNNILKEYRDPMMQQTMIYIPNYFDFVRVRNYFKKEDISFVQICEYSNMNKIARARDMFFHGEVHFLLYTERYHFFNRKKIKGIRHLIFYQLPTFPHFYPEMCNLMQEENQNRKLAKHDNRSISVLYSKYDVQQMNAVVGKQRAVNMIKKDKKLQMIVTDFK